MQPLTETSTDSMGLERISLEAKKTFPFSAPHSPQMYLFSELTNKISLQITYQEITRPQISKDTFGYKELKFFSDRVQS